MTQVDRASSLGRFQVLSDSITVEGILALLAPKDLITLSLTSRYLHVFARNDYLWRRLFFKERDYKSTRLVYRGSWLLTYIFPGNEHDEACSNHPLVKSPIIIQGVISELLHQQWLRSNMFFGHFYPPPPVPPTPAIGENRPINPIVLIEDYTKMDQEMFYRRYGYPNRPVMIQNSGVESWPAWEQWTLDALAAKYGDTPFRVANLDSNEVPGFSLCFRDFLHYVRYNRDQDPLYLFDPCFVETVPKYFEFDFFSLLKGDSRPPYRWMLIGPQRTGAPWHIDPSGTSAWNTLLSGHKRWALYPPHIVPPGHDPTSSKLISSVSWYLDIYPLLPPESRPIEIVQHPGQTIYIPSGWWHMVLNMDDTVAVTQNFADETNLTQVKHALLADKAETSQIQRWEALAEKLCKLRPDLALSIKPQPEEILLNELKSQSSWLDPWSEEMNGAWQDRVRTVFARTLNIADLESIEQIETGENVCFLTNRGFVKFFMPLHDGHASYHSEVKANKIYLQAATLQKADGYILAAPALIGHGYLLEVNANAPSEWRWPFIVTENAFQLDLTRHIGHEAISLNPAPLLVPATDFMPEDRYGYNVLLQPILRTLQFLHTLDLASLTESEEFQAQTGPPGASEFLSNCLKSCVQTHMRWRTFPRHLLALLPSYLPTDPKEIFDPSQGDRVASMVHGDVSPSNILGYLDEELEDPDSTTASIDVDVSVTFKPTSLIDYGDAQFSADPLIDIVSVFVAILNCRRDLDMTEHLLDYWQQLNKDATARSGATLSRRCMWHVLLWPSEGLTMHLSRCVPEIGEMTSWQQVEDALFGWCTSL
ncbi:hypothetical protein BG011_008764 [Mortierella polycephala]|uniref:JmjC domain-containing protein n=1 Tax=Mortierella polycephala TaxID=41804 RepID=A0A9P6U761_9FUNG|nr:hypothetical protein BG011_008764 [Mortierella polycephala]